MSVIIEPFRIKSVEPIRFTSRAQRELLLAEAGYNLFLLKSEDVIIDLLTDSGTSAMSAAQWAAMMTGDEAYAGSPSFFKFEAAVKGLTGLPIVIPTHQGRASEKILFSAICKPGMAIAANTHFDTTRANVEYTGAEAVDLLTAEGRDPADWSHFKGNMDTAALKEWLAGRAPGSVAGILLTVTNNSGGGQPVSMANIREVAGIARQHGVPFILDACRFAENAWFIREREAGYENASPKEIAQEMFSYADIVSFSAKKDAFANIGGFLAMRDPELAAQCRNLLILTEGFPTYGGLAGRDLEAIAQGLEEIVDPDYLRYRIRTIEYLHEKLTTAGVPLLNPPGGHALYLDAKGFLPQVPVLQYPGQVIACQLYLQAGIRCCEIGSVMFGKYDAAGRLLPAAMELVRLAMPRRVYTQSHFDYVAEAIIEVYQQRDQLRGIEIVEEAPFLRHFTARFQPMPAN